MMKDYQKNYDTSPGNNLILSFKGDITFERINVILNQLENILENESDLRTRKKVYNIAMECFQNLGHHLDKKSNPYGKNGMLAVEMEEGYYAVVTANYVFNELIGKIRSKIDAINETGSREELREMYKQSISKQGFSDKGTAGLGFLDMAIKSGEKIIYNFHTFNEQVSFFTFKVIVKKQYVSVKTVNAIN